MKRITYVIILIIHLSVINKSLASSVKASSFGWNATDATTAFRNAIKSNNDTIFIDLQASDWILKPVTFDSLYNKTIIFENGVNVVAKPGAYSNIYAVLLRFNESDNVTLIGYGATLKMQKSEYIAYNNSEYRSCVSLSSCNNFKIYGFKIMDSGGDGIYVGAYTFPYKTFSENIFLKDLWCDNNYRQGISVTSVQHLRVENCWFTNTKGTPPAYGVDLEPFRNSQRLVDVVFDKCRFMGNAGGGILVIPLDLDSTSIPIDITFSNCYIDGNGDKRYQIKIGGSTAKVAKSAPGIVKFENCMTDNNSGTAVGITKLANGYKAYFNNCVFNNSAEYPINFDDYSTAASGIRFGGVSFTNCMASYKSTNRFLNAWSANPASAGMGDVQVNNLTVLNPNNVTYFPGGKPAANCTFNFQKFTEAPPTSVQYSVGENLIECSSTHSQLQFSREANSSLNYPIGIAYTLKGTGIQGFDYSRAPLFKIIPKDSLFATDSIFVLADNTIEPIKIDSVVLNPSDYFKTSSPSQNFTIRDILLPIIKVNMATICSGQSATLTATGAANYLWNNNEVGSSIQVSPLDTTYYTVTGNFNGCPTASVNTQVNVKQLPIVTVDSVEICKGQTAVLVAKGASDYIWSNNETGYTMVVSPEETTSYTVIGKSEDCESKPVEGKVIVNPLPSIYLGPDTVLQTAQEIIFSASNNGSTYLWSTGATTEKITVNEMGTYSVIVTNEHNCSASDTIRVSILSSIDEDKIDIFEIVPNPTHNFLNIKSKVAISRIEVIDLLGRVYIVTNSIVGNTNHLLEVSHMDSGTYFVKLYINNEVKSIQVVKI